MTHALSQGKTSRWPRRDVPTVGFATSVTSYKVDSDEMSAGKQGLQRMLPDVANEDLSGADRRARIRERLAAKGRSFDVGDSAEQAAEDLAVATSLSAVQLDLMARDDLEH